MICKVCGRTISNEEANFCEYCGASFRELRMNGHQPLMNEAQVVQSADLYESKEPNWSGQSSMKQGFGQELHQQNQRMRDTVGLQKKHPMSFLQWLGIMLLPFVPLIGAISYVVLLFVWAFGKDTEESKKNWARARLVYVAFLLIMTAVFMASALSSLSTSGLSLEDWLRTTYYK